MINERISYTLSLMQGPSILHLGCCGNINQVRGLDNRNWLHYHLVEAGYSVLGGDITLDQLNIMEARGYDVVEMDAQAIPNDSPLFDSIVAGELIEHLDSPGLFLEGVKDRLAPGGRLILTTPNAFSVMLFLLYVKNFDQAFNKEHTCCFDAQTLTQLLTRKGFKVCSLRFVDDLRPDVTVSPFYKAFSYLWPFVRRVFPARFRNTMVVCATLNDESQAK